MHALCHHCIFAATVKLVFVSIFGMAKCKWRSPCLFFWCSKKHPSKEKTKRVAHINLLIVLLFVKKLLHQSLGTPFFVCFQDLIFGSACQQHHGAMGAAFVATLLLICSVCAKQLSKNVELHTNLLELDPNVQSVWTQETIPTALRYYYNGTWLRMLPKSDEVSWGALNSTSTQCEVIQSVLAIVDTLLTTANNTSK